MSGPLRLADLATAKGAIRLQKALGATNEEASKFLVYANKYLKDSPDLHSLRIGLSNSSFYDHNQPRIGLHSSNPEVFAHELGHAAHLGLAKSKYKNLVLPAASGIESMSRKPLSSYVAKGLASGDPVEAASRIDQASVASALLKAPSLYNEIMASHIAASNSGSYIKTLAKLAPGLAGHVMDSLSPVAKLQAMKYIKDLPESVRMYAPKAIGVPGYIKGDFSETNIISRLLKRYKNEPKDTTSYTTLV